MFTGLVDDVGLVERVDVTDAGREFRVRCRYDDLVDGESVACDGVCLTVREKGAGWFTVAAAFMTLERTTLGDWAAGRRVNLERALRLGDRLGGHMVQGHVDAVGTVRSAVVHEDALLIDVAVPDEIDALLVPHGSITLDGVSLTVNALPAPGILQVSIIEYTRRHTTLGDRAAGDGINVEADVIAKHVQRLIAPHLTTRT
ncbi:Lumazine-binding domain protein [Gemmatirosa kalamazoonensis]|uniref:Riboflavin synthase n=1 Tax=Gemmatirosa kalamazoonensis TaxID=861299 RepID=W0RJQ1_9BACT|nr:riboflavin synthase [Gemmatirosa kalamazoonensis]AHG90652.1 Lumazine-binding domain protein [Gemmatirosa kalamazoonensis]